MMKTMDTDPDIYAVVSLQDGRTVTEEYELEENDFVIPPVDLIKVLRRVMKEMNNG